MKYLIFFFSISTLLFTSCTKEDLFSDSINYQFNLQNDEAIMPVLVKGNSNSGKFCIVLHGGPGDSGIQVFANGNILSNVEDDFAMVYFDQRCAGLSSGNCDGEKLEVADFVKDIDQLIKVLKFKFGNESMFYLLGHSWGATLGLDYLANGALKNEIKAFILTNGSHNIPKLGTEQRNYIRKLGAEQINAGNEVSEWTRILEVINAADSTTLDGKLDQLTETYNTRPLLQAVDSINAVQLQASKIGSLLLNIPLTTHNTNVNGKRPFVEKLFDYDITPKLHEVNTPISILWGKFDTIHPYTMAEDIINHIGSNEKELLIFNRSFHSPMATENTKFQNKVQEVIDYYN